ncbi:hypothetical protein MNEG_6404 [Monoraphidium neglectum]|uniref:Uncharacterized protein n=1 Tax=Monoraphidium neglectum TaxID=145388 RepID=A0A0D2JR32_9CHLO|nr:hypothetical protein MNEG_6404 [Monoraphidium neglectum]KIZ01553.1 hypothetical protein MNEG_6404 [Monoraphidium neglectum]|eukprot:XP_013900572.1 hypothetical protein MNEG_6404 [Monoraphidium neglectum]
MRHLVHLAIAALVVGLAHAAAPAPAEGTSNYYVHLIPDLMEAQMRYLLCVPDGEAGDVLLHHLVTETARTHAPASCDAWPAIATDLARRAAAAAAVDGSKTKLGGCAGVKCTDKTGGRSHTLTLDMPLYVRLLEFAHEQAPACKDPSQAITAAASALLRDCSSGGEACAIDKYYALRPGAKEGCSVPPELAALAKGE